jgi:hypothetical protein
LKSLCGSLSLSFSIHIKPLVFDYVLFVTFSFCTTLHLLPSSQVRTVKMLAQAVCSMTVCQNSAAGVNCMWASSYDGELSSWVIDELCAPVLAKSSFLIFCCCHNVCIGLKTICRAQYPGRLLLIHNLEILWILPSAQVQFQRTSRRTLHVFCNSYQS